MGRNYTRKTEDRWTKEGLLEALMCIKAGKLEIKDAARQYGIPKATLKLHYPRFRFDGAKSDVNQFRKRGAKPILSKMEEDVLEKTIRDLREQGFTVISGDIRRICFEYCCSNGIPNQFNQEKRMASRDWYYGFLKRHPDVKIPNPGQTKSTSRVSSTASTDSFTSPDKSPKSKKLKVTPTPNKIMKPDRTPPRSPVHVFTASPSKVTSGKEEKQSMEVVGAAVNGRKQKEGSVAVAAAPLKKALKRFILTKPSVARGKKGKTILPHIPTVDEEEEAEGADDEEGEAVEERKDAEAENDADEGEEEEEDEDADEDEEDDDEEEEDEDDEDVAVVKTEKDDSDSDGGCSDELLEKLLDMCSDVLVTPMMTSSFPPS